MFAMVTLDMADHTFIFKCILSVICHLTVSESLSNFLIIHILSRHTKCKAVSPFTISLNSVILSTCTIHLPLSKHIKTYAFMILKPNSSYCSVQYYLVHEYEHLHNIYLFLTWKSASLKSAQNRNP
jgi:hypothetical protein